MDEWSFGRIKAEIDLTNGEVGQKLSCGRLLLRALCLYMRGFIIVLVALFAVISGGRGSISIEQLVQFLEQIVQASNFTSHLMAGFHRVFSFRFHSW